MMSDAHTGRGECAGKDSAAAAGHASLCRTMRELSAAVRSLADYGLDCSDTAALSGEGVAQTLITDEWQCDQCHDTHAAVCARTGAPHRRRLVCIAAHILRLVGARAGQWCVRPARLSQRRDGDVAVRPQRRIVMNPQLLLLAFYFVATSSSSSEATTATATTTTAKTLSQVRDDDDDNRCDDDNNDADAASLSAPSSSSDALVAACAQQLLDVLHQIAVYGRRFEHEMNARYATTLLRGFCAAWRRYVRHVERDVHGDTAADRRAAAEELFLATRDALLAAARQCAAAQPSRHDDADNNNDNNNEDDNDEHDSKHDLRAFVALLYQRLTRLAPPARVREVDDALARIAAEHDARRARAREHNDDDNNNDAAAAAQATRVAAAAAATDVHAESSRNDTHDNDDDKAATDDAAPLPTSAATAATLSSSSSSVEDSPGREWRRPLQLTTLALSDAHTSASDEADAALTLPPPARIANTKEAAATAATTTATTPRPTAALPPHWYVDEHGRSRPPHDCDKRAQRERYVRLEFRARKAYEAALRNNSNNNSNAGAASLSDAQVAELAQQLNDVSGAADGATATWARRRRRLLLLRRMLRLVEQRMLDAVPPRLRHRLAQEFRDVLDWPMLLQQQQQQQRGDDHVSSASDTDKDNSHQHDNHDNDDDDVTSVRGVVQFVTNKVVEYGAPAREAALRARAEHVCRALQLGEPDVGTAMARAFAFALDAIRELADDVAAFSLAMVASHLREHAVTYVRDFVSSCLPAPRAWASTRAFVQAFVNDTAVCAWADSAAVTAALAATALSRDERRVRGALRGGAIDLLRSAHRTTATRWATLPAECFYFEQPLLFRAANAVQESALLLLLEATVSSLLAGKGLTHAQVATTLRRLHAEIVQLLAGDVTLARLKSSVADFLDRLLCSTETAPASRRRAYMRRHNNNDERDDDDDDDATTTRALSDVERRVVAATMDKMTDTSNALYVAFEKKILQYMSAMLLSTTRDARHGDTAPPPLGLVTDTIQQHARELDKALAFNWEVYAPYYRELLPTLDIE